MKTMNKLHLFSTALVTLALGVSPAFANESASVDSASRGAAREIAQEGVEAYQNEDYASALDRLERAYKVLRVPSLALWSGRALEQNGKLVEAAERYLEATRMTVDDGSERAVQEASQRDAKAAHDTLAPRIPKLVIEIDGAAAESVDVTVAGEPVSSSLLGIARPTNPGTFKVVGKVGSELVEEEVTLAEGEKQSVTLRFTGAGMAGEPETPLAEEPAPPEENPAKDSGTGARWQPIAGWSAIGLGGAGIIFGSVMGIVASGKRNSLDCVDNVCPAGTDTSSYDSARTMSSVGIIAGGVLAAAGVTLLLTAPPPSDRAYVAPYVGFTSLGLTGNF